MRLCDLELLCNACLLYRWHKFFSDVFVSHFVAKRRETTHATSFIHIYLYNHCNSFACTFQYGLTIPIPNIPCTTTHSVQAASINKVVKLFRSFFCLYRFAIFIKTFQLATGCWLLFIECNNTIAHHLTRPQYQQVPNHCVWRFVFCENFILFIVSTYRNDLPGAHDYF